jgi:hypothetical protein
MNWATDSCYRQLGGNRTDICCDGGAKFSKLKYRIPNMNFRKQ